MSKEIQNHYLAGRQAWSEMYGSFIQERNRWRLVALLVSIVAILLGAGNIIQLRQQKVIPYMVEVDRAGRISGGQMAQKLETSQEMIQYSLAQFITAWRTVTADIALQEKYVKQSSFMSIGAAKKILAKWYARQQPIHLQRKKIGRSPDYGLASVCQRRNLAGRMDRNRANSSRG